MKLFLSSLFTVVTLTMFAQTANDSTETNDPNAVYDVVDVAAEPVGGMSVFYQSISKNIQYPADARKHNITGKVFVQFVVEKDGKILAENVQVIKPLYKSIDKEAKRIILLTSPWQPAQKGGTAVRARKTLPITFNLGG